MNCKNVLSRLRAYADGEVPELLARQMREHFGSCPSCRTRLEDICRLNEMLDRLDVPPLPGGFAARVAVEARRRTARAKEGRIRPPLGWRPLRWLFDLSSSMRLAACAIVLAACFLGIFMSREIFHIRNTPAPVADVHTLDGLEWFNATPPASLGTAYLTLALTTPEEQGCVQDASFKDKRAGE